MNRTLAGAICFSLLISLACSGADSNRSDAATADASPAAVTVEGEQPSPSTGTSAPSPEQVAPSMAVSAHAAEVSVPRGGTAEATVQVVVASGYHVNANPPSFPYLRPTELRITPADGIRTGAPIYPAAESKKFAFAERPIAVYEGTATIRLPVRASADAPTGAHRLNATVQVQPCNDQACFPTRILETTLPVLVQ